MTPAELRQLAAYLRHLPAIPSVTGLDEVGITPRTRDEVCDALTAAAAEIERLALYAPPLGYAAFWVGPELAALMDGGRAPLHVWLEAREDGRLVVVFENAAGRRLAVGEVTRP